MNNLDLVTFINKISLHYFGLPFKHNACWNSRLQTTGGRFFPKDCHLDFNPKMMKTPDFEKIVLHELCHYHLYLQNKGYKHRDLEFKQLLAQVGGLRYAPQLETKNFRLLYLCDTCGKCYLRQRKINTRKYRCGQCKGHLILINSKASS